jgi:LemA protein
MPKFLVIVVGGMVALLLLAVGCSVSSYNKLVSLEQEVQKQWAQVENVYQRRADLVPNLVETVKGAAKFERETLKEVVDARARAVQAAPGGAPPGDAQALQKFQQAQDQLGSALSRLMVVVERYPELKATQNFRDLQAQLEGTENRIAVERMRYNERVQEYNTSRRQFPANITASVFGFKEYPFFEVPESAKQVPKVSF